MKHVMRRTAGQVARRHPLHKQDKSGNEVLLDREQQGLDDWLLQCVALASPTAQWCGAICIVEIEPPKTSKNQLTDPKWRR